MTYFCPECKTPVLQIGEYTFYCVNCQKKVGAMARDSCSHNSQKMEE